jgi:hypothetical protein
MSGSAIETSSALARRPHRSRNWLRDCEGFVQMVKRFHVASFIRAQSFTTG